VLSRRPSQSIAFPTLGVTVRIQGVNGQTVRVGVDAPPSVPVLREELVAGDGLGPPGLAGAAGEEAARQARHHRAGRLNTATMALCRAQRHLESGSTSEADSLLQSALDEWRRLAEEAPAADTRKQKSAPRRIRALLVEDNRHERALLESYLRLSGVEVANTGD